MGKIFRENIDSNPYTGIQKISGKVKVKETDFIKNFFNGTENFEQVKNVTPGKIYNVVQKEGHGDVEDIFIIDDANEIHSLGDFFFEEVEESLEYQPGNY